MWKEIVAEQTYVFTDGMSIREVDLEQRNAPIEVARGCGSAETEVNRPPQLKPFAKKTCRRACRPLKRARNIRKSREPRLESRGYGSLADFRRRSSRSIGCYPCFTQGNSHRPSPSSSFGSGTALPMRLSCVSSQSFAYFQNV